jgi:hypothetical protein
LLTAVQTLIWYLYAAVFDLNDAPPWIKESNNILLLDGVFPIYESSGFKE